MDDAENQKVEIEKIKLAVNNLSSPDEHYLSQGYQDTSFAPQPQLKLHVYRK